MVVIVVALDDWMISVTKAPQKVPDSGLAAALLRVVRSLEPASALRPLVMTLMPRRNSPMPPRTEIVVDMRALPGCIESRRPTAGRRLLVADPLVPRGQSGLPRMRSG